jgi:hypothetical protein
MAETIVKRLLCCGFRRSDKAMGQVYKCWWRICREINVFQVRISHVLCLIFILTDFLTLARAVGTGGFQLSAESQLLAVRRSTLSAG